MRVNLLPSQVYLQSLFYYQHETGLLYWRPQPLQHFQTTQRGIGWNRRYANTPAGTLVKGSLRVNIRGQLYATHRIIWKLVTGEEPNCLIDHKNGLPCCNKFDNLRLATNAQNNYNQKRSTANKTGFKGVSFHKASGKFRATIRCQEGQKHLGLFDSALEAYATYCQAAEKYHGEFANVGKPVEGESGVEADARARGV